MPKFAIYTIPPANSAMYQHGSAILGYDVRTGEFLPEDNPTRSKLPEFDSAWITQPQTYGFHATTGYSLYFNHEDMPAIEAEIESVCRCFGNVDFLLTPTAERVMFWRDTIVVLHYEPNINMAMLHTMLVARVNPLGTYSNMTKRYAGKTSPEVDPTLAHRVATYHTPYMLDGWNPHFTLMMPYMGNKQVEMKSTLLDLFDDEPLKVESICLLYRGDDDTHYRLHKELALPG
ncbi:MAG: hypothetical protein AAFV33_25920 [Chloroflexota bacterium]